MGHSPWRQRRAVMSDSSTMVYRSSQYLNKLRSKFKSRLSSYCFTAPQRNKLTINSQSSLYIDLDLRFEICMGMRTTDDYTIDPVSKGNMGGLELTGLFTWGDHELITMFFQVKPGLEVNHKFLASRFTRML